jgi:hypothetical protein
MPIMVKAKYNLTNGALHPYVGIGAGINVIRYDKYYGEFVDYDHVIRFAAQPELGVHIPFVSSDKIGLNIGADIITCHIKMARWMDCIILHSKVA